MTEGKPAAILGSALFLVLAPGTVAILVPWLVSRWQIGPPLLGFWRVPVLGALLVVIGLPVLIDSFARFAVMGLGTPAPIAPTQHLVVSGMYRCVRNPMYLAVVSLIAGQGLLFGSVGLLAYAVAMWAAFHLFVLAYEEPTLLDTHGVEYEGYRAHVRRWIPRIRPWRAPDAR